jgi:hypothetical protein
MAWRIGGHRIHVGWLIICAVILTAAGGGFGGGTASRHLATTPDEALRLQYQGLWRLNAPTQLELRTHTVPHGKGPLRIALNRGYLQSVRIDWILPEPYLVTGTMDRVIFHFLSAPGEHDMAIDFAVTPLDYGVLRGQIGIEGEQPVRFRQFIYP